MILFHGSSKRFDEFNQPITWLTSDYDYALEFSEFASDVNYMYSCEIPDDLNLFDCGDTGGNCFSLIPLKPFRLSDKLQDIVDRLDVDESEIRDIIESVANEYDEPMGGYKMHIHVLTRSKQFRDLLFDLGYDGVKCIEEGKDTWGIFDPENVIITGMADVGRDSIESAMSELSDEEY